MAATDSTLKTQMYLGESQRQNALDFSKQISGMFSAISEGQKFAGDVNRSMVQSAFNYKRVEMEEYYKNESLKMDARKLALAEQETKIKIGQENRRIDIAERDTASREKYYTAIAEEKKKSEEYKVILGEIDSDTSRYASMIDVKNAEIKTLEDQRQAIASSVTAQLNALPVTASDAEREAIRANAASLISRLDATISEHRGAISPLTSRLGDFIALKSLASGRSRAVSDIAKSLTELRTPKQESTSPEFFPSVNDPSRRSDPFQSQPLPVPQYQYGASDIQRVLIQPRGSDYNPEAARYVFDRLPDVKKAELGQAYNYHRNEIFDAYFAPKEDRPSSSREEPDGIDFVDRFNALANKDVMGIGSEASRIKKIAEQAYDDYYSLPEDQRKPLPEYRSETLAKALGITETNPNLPPKPTVVSGSQAARALFGASSVTIPFAPKIETEKKVPFVADEIAKELYPDETTRVLALNSGDAKKPIYEYALERKVKSFSDQFNNTYIRNGKPDITALFGALKSLTTAELEMATPSSSAYDPSGMASLSVQSKEERIAELIKNPEEAKRIILKAKIDKDPDLARLR
jgi:hypothetical protein